MANFELSAGAKHAITTAQDEQDEIRRQQEARAKAGGAAQGIATADEVARTDRAEAAKFRAEGDDQASRGGVETAQATTGAQGIAGFFGGKEATTRYTAGRSVDKTTGSNKDKLDALTASVNARDNQTMQSAQMRSAQVNTGQADQFRARQTALADSLEDASAGRGPSAAQAQLQAGSDQAVADAMSLARSGRGSPGAAMKQALAAQGKIGQQTANQSAMLKAQEMQAARGQLAGLAESARGQDLSTATANSGLVQDTNKTNATFQQEAARTNLQAGVEQQKQKDSMVSQFVSQGLSLDQAKRQADIQQAQFNADLLARQAAADKGISMQAAAQGGQTLGTIAATAGTVLAAAASDKRAKKNITDGDDESHKFLRSLHAKGFEYKDDKFGRGHHLGVMAQDVEKTAPDLVIDDTDGVKKIDIRKALSASLASLGAINKRLDKIEGRKRG